MVNQCDPLKPCENLDGRLLLKRTIYGPQFGFDPRSTLSGLATSGAGLRPYATLHFEVSWRQVGLCQGPPSSVMGLAPGEVVTVGIRTRESRSFSRLISNAAESTKTISHTNKQSQTNTQSSQPNSGGEGGFNPLDLIETGISLAPVFISSFGSILGDALSVVGGIAGGLLGGAAGAAAGAAAGGAIGDLIDDGISGNGGGTPSTISNTATITSEILDSVTRSESQSHLQQTTVTTSEETVQTVKRTFGNPYLNRTLQLRFIPVFNQFEVTVSLVRVVPGLVGFFAEPITSSMPSSLMGAMLQGGVKGSIEAEKTMTRAVASHLFAASQIGDDDGLRTPMVNFLRNLTKSNVDKVMKTLEQGLSWDRTEVQGNGIHVPISTSENVISAWKLKDAKAKAFIDSLKRISYDRLEFIFKPLLKKVTVFAGTHIEAVPGDCILPDIPDDFKVIVPGGSQYVIREAKTD